MKAINLLIVTASLLFVQLNHLQAQSLKVKNYKMTVQGTSSLHDWESNVEKLECKGSIVVAGNGLDIKDIVVKVPVASIKSTKGKMMDNKTYDAFNHKQNPNIIFTMTGKKVNESNLTIDVKGTVSMAGTTKPITLVLNYKVLANGEIQITGSKKIILADFKMKPPTAMMGTIKVGDEVVVGFDITLSTNNTIL